MIKAGREIASGCEPRLRMPTALMLGAVPETFFLIRELE
jgi:hypothetical protein